MQKSKTKAQLIEEIRALIDTAVENERLDEEGFTYVRLDVIAATSYEIDIPELGYDDFDSGEITETLMLDEHSGEPTVVGVVSLEAFVGAMALLWRKESKGKGKTYVCLPKPEDYGNYLGTFCRLKPATKYDLESMVDELTRFAAQPSSEDRQEAQHSVQQYTNQHGVVALAKLIEREEAK